MDRPIDSVIAAAVIDKFSIPPPLPAPGDYSNLNTQIVFTVGQSTGAVACADLQVVDDNVVEEDEESLDLTMSADEPLVTATTAVSATVTIRENDNDGKKENASKSCLLS